MEVFSARLREVMERRGLSDAQVADMVTEQTGVTMTRVYVTLLRSGKQKNPTVARLKALAQVLEVRPSYLLGEADPADEAPFASLSNESRNALRTVLELARRADRLPPVGWNEAGAPRVQWASGAEPSVAQEVHHPFTLEQIQQAFGPDAGRTPPNRVGGRLRDLRRAAGLSTAEADLVLGGEPVVEDIEAGSTTPSTAMLRTLLARYGVVDSYQQELFVSAAAGRLDTRWWFPYFQRLPLWLVTYMEMEDSATQIRMYSDTTVPGLLQHEDYAVAMRRSAHFPEVPADQIELGIEILRERQRRVLTERPVKLWAVLQESALLDDLGGTEVQLRQLDHLMDLAARPNITIQINRGGPDRYRPRGGAFSLLRLPEEGVLDVAWIPQLSDDRMVSDTSGVLAYSMAHGRLALSASRPDRALEELRTIRGRVARESASCRALTAGTESS
ncbi:Scr1 family TA system antitoxin-like transcriptional regulator [Nonomuraea fuscirosea]